MRNNTLSVLFIVLVTLTVLVTLNTVAAQETELFPSEWIVKVPIVLEQRGDEADVYVPEPPADVRPFFNDAFPIVAVLQGAQVDKGFYEQFGNRLARHGFTVVITNHLQVLGPPGTPHVPFPDQLVVTDVLAQMTLEDANPASPLHTIVDLERMGLAGHSVGGVVGLYVIEGSCNPPFCFGFFQRPEAVRAGAFYGTNTCSPAGLVSDPRCFPSGTLIDIETDNIPVALVQGSLDGLATPAEAAATLDILDGPGELITIDGANHYGITDVNNPQGATIDSSVPTVPQSEAVQQVADAMGQFLRTHVKDQSTSVAKVFVDQDSWLKQAAPYDNFGDEKELPVKNKPGDSERAVFRFDLSDIPPYSKVRAANARFRVTTPDTRPINVYRITEAWTEFNVNWWNTGNNFDGSMPAGSFTPWSDDVFVSVDLTSLVQDWVCGTPNHGIMFIATSNDEQSKYHSIDMDIPSFRPFMKIELSAVPSPCTLP